MQRICTKTRNEKYALPKILLHEICKLLTFESTRGFPRFRLCKWWRGRGNRWSPRTWGCLPILSYSKSENLKWKAIKMNPKNNLDQPSENCSKILTFRTFDKKFIYRLLRLFLHSFTSPRITIEIFQDSSPTPWTTMEVIASLDPGGDSSPLVMSCLDIVILLWLTLITSIRLSTFSCLNLTSSSVYLSCLLRSSAHTWCRFPLQCLLL